MPPTGSQARRTPNQKMRRMPSQKDGVDMPTSTVTVISLSCQPFCRMAAMMPKRMPKTLERTSAVPARRSVG